MLSTQANERLTRVGPGTPCGELMRRYWIPIAPFSQLLDEPVRKVRVLGEDLVLFRDRSGGLGLIGERCLHRAVDLQWGIPDECGLRCPYHGWLYGADGRCLDQPLEDPSSTFKDRLRITAYPLRELGGLVFAYMGPKPEPLLPPWDLFVWPNAIRQIAVNVLNCNWLQCQENTGDPTHSVWLHGHLFRYVLERTGQLESRGADRPDHTIPGRIKMGVGIKDLFARATQYGIAKGIVYSRDLGADRDGESRHSTVVFPFYTQTGRAGSPRSEFQIRVPMDDEHTYHICYQVYAAPPGIEAPKQDVIPWYEVPLADERGKPILDHVLSQDMLAWQAQGVVTDRSEEHLGRTDKPIILLRRQLEEQLAKVAAGEEPMNVFRDAAAMGDILYGSGAPPQEWTPGAVSMAGLYRARYHKGFVVDDGDRYGPAVPLVAELHRRIEESRLAADKGAAYVDEPQPVSSGRS